VTKGAGRGERCLFAGKPDRVRKNRLGSSMEETNAEKNIRLVLAYDGSRYHGWQRQKNGLTVQEVLEDKIETIVQRRVRVTASGRTDAGVHALHQVCNFLIRSCISPEAMRKGLNSLLPEDIFVKVCEQAPLTFHARYSAKSKIYEYRLLNRKDPDIFGRRYLWHVPVALRLGEMRRCLALLVGRHDFSSFRSTGSGNIDPTRCIRRAELQVCEGGVLKVVIEADGFLRHMVRNIVGTVVEVGLGKRDFDSFGRIFESKDRRLAGMKAPPQGLYLVNVLY
jgi:tRNA pseudouridine38-40 synthase